MSTNRMVQTKDSVATSLLTFVCKEHEISQTALSLLKAQLEFHETCAKEIKAVLPELQVKR